MPVPFLIVISLLAAVPRHAAPNLNGTWTLDRVKCHFGAAGAPRQFIVRLDQEDDRLDITMFIADANGRRVIHREAQQLKNAEGLLWISSDGAGEDWRVTATGELTIKRVIPVASHITWQRLVLSKASIWE